MRLFTCTRWIVCLLACMTGVISGCDRSGEKSGPQTKWVDPKSLTQGPIQRESLTDEQMVRVTRLHKVFQEVDSSPLEKWVDDFRRDIHPENEMKIWENMAEAYEGYTASKTLSLDAKKEVFRVVLLRSGAPEQEVISHLKLKVLGEKDVKEIMALYPAAPESIQIVKP